LVILIFNLLPSIRKGSLRLGTSTLYAQDCREGEMCGINNEDSEGFLEGLQYWNDVGDNLNSLLTNWYDDAALQDRQDQAAWVAEMNSWTQNALSELDAVNRDFFESWAAESSQTLFEYPESMPITLTDQVYACNIGLREILNNHQIEEDNDLAEILNNPSPIRCHGTKRNGNVLWPGNQAHRLIQTYYLALHPDGFMEYIIPTASSSGSGYPGYADIVHPPTGQMFEIKTVAGAAAGSTELGTYVFKANQQCPQSPAWIRGADYPTVYLPAVDQSKCYLVQMSTTFPGVVTYEEALRSTTPSFDPVSIPVSVQNALNELIERIKIKKQLQPSFATSAAARSVIPAWACNNGASNIQDFMAGLSDAQRALRVVSLATKFIELGSIALTEAEAYEILIMLILL
jgi:hypothetical protein